MPIGVDRNQVGDQKHIMASERTSLKILLAAPRGFCAGVERAIQIVEIALAKYGAPVYVRHEIVHNRFVVEQLEEKGAIFVKEIDEVPQGRPVIFSAHGVPKSVPQDARERDLFYLDATCPLVSKVHVEAERHHREGYEIVMIGHEGHPEVIGTLGQLPPGSISLIETTSDVATFTPQDPNKLAYITQTTLSVDDTTEIVEALVKKFPAIKGPHKEDICYATTNRQEAVKAIARQCDTMLVIGAPNSSNSQRLVEVAMRQGCPTAYLVPRAEDIDWKWLDGVHSLGITAGASAPEVLVDEVLRAVKERFDVEVEEITIRQEDVQFKLPRILTAA